MNEPTTVNVETRPNGLLLIKIHGDLDSMGTQMVDEPLNGAITDRTSRVLIDLSDVGFISSAGMAMLLVKGKTLRRGGGNMYLASATERVREVLALAGFNELFNVYNTLDEALKTLESGSAGD
jgi:anti-anti-sigma factor